MATIAQNLQKIIDSKAAIKTSINNKGGSVTDSTPLDEYSTAIDNLPSGGGGSSYVKPAEDSVVESYSDGVSSDAACSLACYLEEIKFYSKYQITYGGLLLTGNSYGVNKSTKKITLPSGQYSFGSNLCKKSVALEEVLGNVSVDSIGSDTFSNCTNLKVFSPSFSTCTSINSYAFFGCGFNVWYNDHSTAGQLGDVVLRDGCTVVNQAFNGANFNSISVNCATLEQNALGILGTTVTIGANCTSIHYATLAYDGDLRYTSGTTFSRASGINVTTLIMKGTTPPQLSFKFNPDSSLQHIYVPASAVSTYKAATNWSNYANIIEANPNA